LIKYLQTRGAYFEVAEVELPPPPELEPEPEPEPELVEPKGKSAPKRAKRTYVRRKTAKKRS